MVKNLLKPMMDISIHGDYRIMHSARQGVTKYYVDVNAKHLLNAFYKTPEAQIQSQKQLQLLKTVFGEEFLSFSLESKLNSSTANLLIQSNKTFKQSCQQTTFHADKTLQTILML
jgi:hypothetical protein